jgi:hypothetical protein
MGNFLIGGLVALLSLSYANATIYSEIDTARILKCTFSSIHHNRILIEGGRVQKLIFPQEQLYVCLEEESGQAFIQSKEHSDTSITVSVVTSKGLVQDIEIFFKDIPAEIVILQERHALEATKPPCIDFGSMVHEKIKAIASGAVPAGFVAAPFAGKSWNPKYGLKAHTFLKLTDYQETLFVFEITNKSTGKKCILESDIHCNRMRWVYLERNIIRPGQTIMGVISCHD